MPQRGFGENPFGTCEFGDPADGMDQDGNLVPTPPGKTPALSAPAKIEASTNNAFSNFNGVIKSFVKEFNLLLLYVQNDQYSNAVYLRDLGQPVPFKVTDPFGHVFTFSATFKDLYPPRYGFMYPYPLDVTLKIVSDITVVS